MKLFSQQLDEESERAFEALSRSEIHTVLSASCEIRAGGSVLTVGSISIQIEPERFVVIENDWSDTPIEGIDYYFLSARIASSPKGIYFNPNWRPGGVGYHADHMSLNLGPLSRVARVDILEYCDEGTDESVRHDAGLLITRADGLVLSITREETISGNLEIAHRPEEIARAVSGLTLRKSFGGPPPEPIPPPE
ncbi:MAG: hypothetical protein Q8P18_06360 [Pseudomonadota bacterium]|nr:hypothetical protein [Pseudomonadota bacterium]